MVEWCTQNLRRDGSISRGTSHATPKGRYQYTTSVAVNMRCKCIESLVSSESHATCAQGPLSLEQGIALYKSYE